MTVWELFIELVIYISAYSQQNYEDKFVFNALNIKMFNDIMCILLTYLMLKYKAAWNLAFNFKIKINYKIDII